MIESWFNKHALGKPQTNSKNQLLVDVHSHILPNLDDGSESLNETIELLQELEMMGYQKIIATPHVMNGYYNNTAEKIHQTLVEVKERLHKNNMLIEIDTAAEYYLDDELLRQIESRKQLLTFGSEKKYLLFETSFVGKLSTCLEAVSKMRDKGYTPVLAHPERYVYLQKDYENLYRLVNHGVLFQININSLTGYYSKQTQELAELLINRKMVSFVGTNCHTRTQLEKIKQARQLPYYEILLRQDILNNSLYAATQKQGNFFGEFKM